MSSFSYQKPGHWERDKKSTTPTGELFDFRPGEVMKEFKSGSVHEDVFFKADIEAVKKAPGRRRAWRVLKTQIASIRSLFDLRQTRKVAAGSKDLRWVITWYCT